MQASRVVLEIPAAGLLLAPNGPIASTVDNTPRLDTLNGFGFPPIEVIYNREVLDSLN